MSKYQRGKEAARAAAQEWQINQNYTYKDFYYWSEIAQIQAHFEKLGRRYGLLTEFRENGII